MFGEVRKGNLAAVGDWLTKNVFSIASLKNPDDWIRAVTGESLNVKFYLDYLEEKFKSVYDIK